MYSVTYTNGIETAKELVSEKVVKEPVTEIIANNFEFIERKEHKDMASMGESVPFDEF